MHPPHNGTPTGLRRRQRDRTSDIATSITPASDGAQAPVTADALPRCVKCGEAVVRSSDEYCHPCFAAEIRSFSPEPE